MTQNTKIFAIFNAVWFQAGWWLAILQQDLVIGWLVLGLVLHWVVSPHRLSDLTIMACVVPVGGLFDGLMSYTGVIGFRGGEAILGVPVWLILVWCYFACTLNHSMAWLAGIPKLWLAGIGAISAMASYYGGARLDAAEIPHFVWFAASYSGFWGLLLLSIFSDQSRFIRRPHSAQCGCG
ncbi:DUF2878 domain-containing protein [Halioxenophilus aromaticivorans]|uniref:DUF2878 domain-containing protein n=1 Tax=Halioxenophilus aromaticivorans TaxID=1306992 RepID=A0AAV3U4D2_9ALTE